MADWNVASDKLAAFNRRGRESQYYAFGARDDSGQERPQIVLIQQPGNEGPNLDTTEGRALCIDDFCKRAEIDRQECDWFRVDTDGKTRAIDVHLRPEQVENPKFAEIKEGDGFARPEDREAAWRAYPPVTVQRTDTTERPPTVEEVGRLRDAFPEGFDMRPYEQPEMAQGPEVKPPTLQEPSTKPDLAGMYFSHSRAIDPDL